MDVSPTGTGSPNFDSLLRLNGPGKPSTPVEASDSVGRLLPVLSTPEIQRFLEAQRFPQDAAVLDGLLQTAGSAATHRDVARALAALAEYINRNPEHASTLPASPLLRPIQGDVRELVRRITLDAKTEAVLLIGTAARIVDTAARHPEKLDGPGALTIAERLVETGQLANYFRASELSQAVIAFYARTVPDAAPGPATARRLNADKSERRPVRRLVARWWGRVPMLVLLVGWFTSGAAWGGIVLLARAVGVELVSPSTVEAAFEIWGVGFLALVVLQFRITVRGLVRTRLKPRVP